MPWKEGSAVSLRREFVDRVLMKEATVSQLCREYGISRKTGYKWLKRYVEEGVEGLQDRSRRPHHSPRRTLQEVEQQVLRVREAHPAWGGRKIRRWLERRGFAPLPPASTITEILRRHGRLDPAESRKHRPWQRFEAEAPNELWQMDFKGHFPLTNGLRCHPLTVLDDHSRFCLALRACGDERRDTVQGHLRDVFRRYGLPERLLVDNGPPWGTDPAERLTRQGVWLVRLGIRLVHIRPYHPQTIGKDERFHRTLSEEVLRYHTFCGLAHAQRLFDPWRTVYNHERPHQAIGMEVPASRYHTSHRPYPETLPPIVYDPGTIVRKVGHQGKISFQNRLYRVGKALYGLPVALQPLDVDGRFEVYFCHHRVALIDLREGS